MGIDCRISTFLSKLILTENIQINWTKDESFELKFKWKNRKYFCVIFFNIDKNNQILKFDNFLYFTS